MEPSAEPEPKRPEASEPSSLARFWEWITEAGWREFALRYASHGALMVILAGAAWATRLNFGRNLATAAPITALEITATPAPQPTAEAVTVTVETLPDVPGLEAPFFDDLVREISLHTDIPTRPRVDVITYKVEQGDTLFGIADKFGLTPETLLWGNYFTLKDNPHSLRPGQDLNILPINGTYHQVVAGQSLRGIAEFYRVDEQTIVDWPGNKLDLENPELVPDTWIVIPGGTRAFTGWPEVPQVTRNTRSAAGGGSVGLSCGGPFTGTVGFGSFIWPANSHRLSGYTYTAYHPGVDIGAKLGDPIFAADGGVVVFAARTSGGYWGYGNMVLIDHGNGWQTLYAHLSQINVGCGQSVSQGSLIGLAGSTGNSSGPHLHFEMRNATYGRVNPLNFLP